MEGGNVIDEGAPAFSPDGSLIAFHRADATGGIFVAGATGESVRRVTDTGFDPAWSRLSPGMVSVAEAMRHAAAEGACEFHFLRGPEAYKYAWGARDRWNIRRSFRRKSL